MGQCQFSYSPPVGWLGLWLGLRSEPYVVGRLGSGPRVGAGGGYPGWVFSVGVCLQGSYLPESAGLTLLRFSSLDRK